MAYSYDDFLKELKRTGYSMSEADMELARKNPDVGISLISLGEDYNKATTKEGKLLAHEAAEELRRSYGGYTGGQDGSGFVVVPQAEKQVGQALGNVGSVGSFHYDEAAPTYENPYAQQQKQLLDMIENREAFKYDPGEDPLWSSYRKSYLREGERASANAMAQAAAATGGIPSSYAMTAAGQAGDYYATKLNDMLPQLEQQAYGRYVDEGNALYQQLQQINAQEQLEYGKYLDNLGQYNADRNFALTEHQAGLDQALAQLGAAQGQSDSEYARALAELERQRAEAQQGQSLAQAQVDAILAAGGVPSKELVAASGYSDEYVSALVAAVAARNAPAAGAGGGYNNGTLTTEQVMLLQNALGVTADGFYGPETQMAAGGVSAEEAYAALVGDQLPDAQGGGYDEVLADVQELRQSGESGATINNVINAAWKAGRITKEEAQALRSSYVGAR